MAKGARILNFSNSGLTPIIQGSRLRSAIPGSNVRFDKRTMIWEGKLRPCELSRLYHVRIVCAPSGIPKVRITQPRLVPPEGKRLPHVYSDGSLCLYHPKKDGPWRSSMVIAETLLPWTAEWLLHYEAWLVTGEWAAGGIHPDAAEKEAA